MPLTYDQAVHCSRVFEEYFSSFTRIDEYMREQKSITLDVPQPLFGFYDEDDFFSDFTIHPKDMNFSVIPVSMERFQGYLDKFSSHINLSNPGRSIQFAVKETTSDRWVGFIRLGSPTIMSKPRNALLETVITNDKNTTKAFNRAAIMGFVIVPTQPFGYNYLGGKLLAGLCCSHEMRELLNKKYEMNLCLFETTSLYGKTKSVSQYDGMKPYLKFGGITESNFLPMIHGKTFNDLKKFVEQSHGGSIVPDDASSRKLKIMNTIIAWSKSALKSDQTEYDRFATIVEKARSLTEQKRYYYSTYGFTNFRDVILGKDTSLVPDKENYDKFYQHNIIEWWKHKASNRFETLHKEGRIRKELEVWTNGKNIDIIR